MDTKYWFEEHIRGDNTLMVLLHGDKHAAQIKGSFEVDNVEEAAKWQKAVDFVNSMSKKS